MIHWSNIAKSIWTKLDMVLFTNKISHALQQCSGVLTNYKMLYEKPTGEHLQILITFSQ